MKTTYFWMKAAALSKELRRSDERISALERDISWIVQEKKTEDFLRVAQVLLDSTAHHPLIKSTPADGLSPISEIVR